MIRLPALLLGALLLLARPFAYASDHDPTWLPGIYDGADGDDEVILAMIAVGSDAVATVSPAPPNEISESIATDADQAPRYCSLRTGGRGPPGLEALAFASPSQSSRTHPVPTIRTGLRVVNLAAADPSSPTVSLDALQREVVP